MTAQFFVNNPKVILGVQYLRGFAAMAVVWVHGLGETSWGSGASYFGTSGVDLFFVISGFIMIATTSVKPLTPGKFFQLRVVRVVPLYWLCTALIIASALSGHSHHQLSLSPVAIAKSAFFIPYWSLDHPTRIWPMLIQGWTLNYEMFFYALFALSLFLRRLRLEALTITLLALAAIGYSMGPFNSAALQVYTSPMLLEFTAGMWIARVWGSGKLRMPLWTAIAALMVGTALLGETRYQPLVMLGATMMLTAILHPRIAGMRFPFFLAIGDASYSIYLTHTFAISALMLVWPHIFPLGSTASWLLFIGVVCLLAIVGGCICYQYIERPLTSLLKGFGWRGPPTAAPVSSS
jgi:exopolysaccharide production protein ExoZ